MNGISGNVLKERDPARERSSEREMRKRERCGRERDVEEREIWKRERFTGSIRKQTDCLFWIN